MRLKQGLTIFLLAMVVVLAGCSRDPNVVKKRYLESGNRYFEKGKLKEARIMYLDALQKDQRYGPAYYRLGLTTMKTGPLVQAVNSFRRAIELLPDDNPDHWDSVVKLSEIYLLAAREQKPMLDEVENYCKQLLQRDPNSFDGHRLSGDLYMARAAMAYSVANREVAANFLKQAMEEYTLANTVKPGNEGVLLQLGRSATASGQFAKAEALYNQILEKNKTSQTAYVELYKLYFYERKLPEAEQVLKTAFQNNPKQFIFLTTLAVHYSLVGRRDDMAAVLQQVKSHAQEFPEAYSVVGDFYLRLGEGETAIREYKEGMAKNPKKKLEYEKKIIEVYVRQGRRADAADLNAAILKEFPNDNDAKGLAAAFLLDKGEINRAVTELAAVVTRSPENPIAHFNLGRAYAARGEFEQARQQFNKAIELRPEFLLARRALGQLQMARSEFDAALATADQILRVDKNNNEARLLRSAALMGQRKFAEARGVLTEILHVNANSADAYFQLGLIGMAENKFKDAEDAFRRAQELNPANPRGVMGVVETEMAQHRPEQALQLLRTEAAKNPKSIDLLIAIGNISVRAGKFDDGIQAFNQALDAMDKNSKQRADVWLRIGETYRRKGDDAAAVTALQKAREITPDSVGVLMTLATTLDHAGRPKEARQAYEATLRLDANNALGLNNLAFLLAENNGDLDDALTKAQKAKQLLPNTYEVADTLGWIYLKKNLSDNALDIFKDLVAKAPNQAIFRYHLGMALYQKGDKPNAIKELTQALKSNPAKSDREKIQQLLTRLSGA
jgi:tetratricopeptide (TPR) repeat protein